MRGSVGVGGDYYDFLELPDGELGIAIGDVSGKGISAALLMANLQAALRSQTLTPPDDLAGLVSRLNKLIYRASAANRYATFFYAQYDPARGLLRYVNAGHNPPLLLRREGQIERLEAGGTVIGLLPTFPFQQAGVVLAPGDLLVAFTDGISERMNAADEEWGEEALLETAQRGRDLPASELLRAIMGAAQAHAAGAPQHDDMTLVVLRAVGM